MHAPSETNVNSIEINNYVITVGAVRSVNSRIRENCMARSPSGLSTSCRMDHSKLQEIDPSPYHCLVVHISFICHQLLEVHANGSAHRALNTNK